MTTLKKWYTPLLYLSAIISIAALFLAVVSINWLYQEEDARNQDRIDTDIASCEAGNVFRQDFKNFGFSVIEAKEANAAMVRNILDLIFQTRTPDTQEEIAELEEFRALLEAPILAYELIIEDIRQQVAAIPFNDCETTVLGRYTNG